MHVEQRENFVADLKRGQRGAELFDHARDIAPEDERRHQVGAPENAAADLVVHRIDAGRVDLDQHFVRMNIRRRHVFHREDIRATKGNEFESLSW